MAMPYNSRSSRSYSRSARPTKSVSSARLSQKSGSQNAFGGIAKVNHGNGTFSMRKTGK